MQQEVKEVYIRGEIAIELDIDQTTNKVSKVIVRDRVPAGVYKTTGAVGNYTFVSAGTSFERSGIKFCFKKDAPPITDEPKWRPCREFIPKEQYDAIKRSSGAADRGDISNDERKSDDVAGSDRDTSATPSGDEDVKYRHDRLEQGYGQNGIKDQPADDAGGQTYRHDRATSGEGREARGRSKRSRGSRGRGRGQHAPRQTDRRGRGQKRYEKPDDSGAPIRPDGDTK